MSRHKAVLIVALLSMVAGSAFAQTAAQPDYSLMSKMASCRKVLCLTKLRSEANGKVERTVLFTRWMMLNPSSRTAAKGLLQNVPANEEELGALMTLPDWHEGATTSEADMQRLDSIYENWPRLLSVAVRRFPEYLPAYIRYGRLAVNDIHSDYTGYERRVCRADQRKFVAAFQALSGDDQDYIRKYVFTPDTCTPIFVSEAE